jgi:pyruvate, water dikinase
VVRLVFGLGTRAVDRSDDDYTRLVALNDPLRRPEPVREGAPEYAQRRVDAIDLVRDRVVSLGIEEVARQSQGLPLHYFATSSWGGPPVLTFDGLLSATPFVEEMRGILATLEAAYRYPVDVEFTANFIAGDELRVNVVQCRPLQVKEGGVIQPPPADLPETSIVLASRGPVIGRSTVAPVDRVVYVDPDAYAALGTQDRHEVARVIGRVTRADPGKAGRVVLLGPGRWGTSTVSLGVPVSFAEIRRVSVICEILRMGTNVVPDVSLGSHFFNDLVEANMLYLAIDPSRPGHRLDEAFLRREPNCLAELVPDDARLAGVVRVVDFPSRGDGRTLVLSANSVRQEVLCWLEPPAAVAPPPFAG